MKLNDLLGPNPVNIELRATNRWEAIDELVTQLVTSGKIQPDHRETISTAIKAREKVSSSGIGLGVGVPHASSPLVQELVVAVGRSHRGVQFDATDGKPVTVVALFLVPEKEFEKHLARVTDLTRLLHQENLYQGEHE